MKALVYEGPREMNIRDVAVPKPGPDEVLIQVAFSGICGSELSGYLGQNSLRKPPIVFGHEFSGTVVEIGEQAATNHAIQLNQRVTANPLVTCGNCLQCIRGNQQLCIHRKLLSAALPGSNAEYVKVPSRLVHALPDHISFQQGALAEPIACAVRVVELAKPSPTDTVVIMGMGPIGLLVLQTMKLYGVTQIIAVDRNESRLRIAAHYGVETVSADKQNTLDAIRHLTEGKGADIAVDAVGSSVTRTNCIQSVTAGGKVIFSGLHESESKLPANELIRNEVTILGSFAYSTANFTEALHWLAAGKIGFSEGVVEAPLEEGKQWYETLLQNPGPVAKVLLTP